jgi:hypothetical protein
MSSAHPGAAGRVEYRSWMSDNLRWDALKLREGDIVISAPPKCGTTWTQRLVSLLVFDGPNLPGPMHLLSPWLDLTAKPIEEVAAALDLQDHRRFIKTHTPLDGLVLDDRVTYIGVGRDPRDAAVSMVLDRNRMRALHNVAGPLPEHLAPPGDFEGEPSLLEVLRSWMDKPITPTQGIASLATILHHYGSVWHRRELPNVALFHTADYKVDPVGELMGLAQVLGIDISCDRAAELAEHTTLDAMRARDPELTPDLWRSPKSVFRAGGRGEWREIFTEAEHRRYRDRAAQLAGQLGGPDLLAWAQEGRRGHDPASAKMKRSRSRASGASPACDHAPAPERVVYRSGMSDNRRWDALELREGDIVISAPSKCGVTWTQRLISLLVFDGPDLPGPFSTVSPWLDRTIRPIEEVVATLDAQEHRRFIKTHTPLDGLVLDDRVTYIGLGRDPRDAAMSELHQWDNMNHTNPNRMQPRHEALPGAFPDGIAPPRSAAPDADRDRSPAEAFRDWMEGPIMPPERMRFAPPVGTGLMPPAKHMGSLANVLHHFGTVWSRRHMPNVAMFHYADYRVDLVSELIRLAQVLGIELGTERAEELAKHATLNSMRARASDLAPESTEGIWRSNERFFRSGGRGEWQEFFTERVYRRYYDRINQLAPPDLLAWAHEGRLGCDPDDPANRGSGALN